MEDEGVVAGAADGDRDRLGGGAAGAIGVMVGNGDGVGLGDVSSGRAGVEIEVPADRILTVGGICKVGDKASEGAGASVLRRDADGRRGARVGIAEGQGAAGGGLVVHGIDHGRAAVTVAGERKCRVGVVAGQRDVRSVVLRVAHRENAAGGSPAIANGRPRPESDIPEIELIRAR